MRDKYWKEKDKIMIICRINHSMPGKKKKNQLKSLLDKMGEFNYMASYTI